MHYKAMIADFDGTLFDSFRHAFKHLGRLAERNNLDFSPAVQQKMLATWGQSGVEFLQNAFGIEQERARRLYLDWEEVDIVDPIPLIEGAHETLKWLHDRGYAVCMLTSRYRTRLMPILARERLQNYFARITAYEDSGYTKPDGRAFTGILQTLARQGVRREECLFVGDTYYDVEAGRSAGITTLVVETGPYRSEHHRGFSVPESHVIPSIRELPSWIWNKTMLLPS